MTLELDRDYLPDDVVAALRRRATPSEAAVLDDVRDATTDDLPITFRSWKFGAHRPYEVVVALLSRATSGQEGVIRELAIAEGILRRCGRCRVVHEAEQKRPGHARTCAAGDCLAQY